MAIVKTQDDYVTRILDNLDFVASEFIDRTAIITALKTAVDWYSSDKPYEKIHSITGDSTNRYVLPSDWSDSFSSIIYVEYPIGNENPTLLDLEDVIVWEDASAKQFQFKFIKPTSADTLLVKYALLHTMSSTTNTVPDADFEAVCFLGTAHAAWEVAGRFIRERSSTGGIGGIVNFQTQTNQYKSYAQEMLKHYYQRMGINPKTGSKANLQIFDLDPQPAWGFDWLTHPRR
tara:strand:- start:440 stop:1135 length:696 start_codon:yes stop_codon:yes gene_type:complete